MKWLKRILSLLHIHNWKVIDYECKDREFFRKSMFRVCKCGAVQEKVCGAWGPLVNNETFKEALKFEEDFQREYYGVKKKMDEILKDC